MVNLSPAIIKKKPRPFFALTELPIASPVEAAADETATAGPGSYPVRCRRCAHLVTSAEKAIAVSGSHGHTYFNPHGIAFELGCFSAAPGIRVEGLLSAEFSWFKGYAWRYALCGNCDAHLGWQFVAETAGDFFGLIFAKLIEE
ncbi:MAG: cereblon family protein [Desulfobulbaceae bacterium]|nr:cereblon family protein [Desulfobulbaceae bacterium]HIJ79662.1 hypothetical protein [Deltaproteobacteria bacterium]